MAFLENLEAAIYQRLQHAMDQIEEAFLRYKDDPEFLKEYDYYLTKNI